MEIETDTHLLVLLHFLEVEFYFLALENLAVDTLELVSARGNADEESTRIEQLGHVRVEMASGLALFDH